MVSAGDRVETQMILISKVTGSFSHQPIHNYRHPKSEEPPGQQEAADSQAHSA